ncbi:Fic family protein [Corynebacterium sanguinis]
MPAAYRPLKQLFHQHSAAYAAEENCRRRESPACLRWPFELGGEEIFIVLHAGLVSTLEEVWRNEYAISQTWSRLPLLARSHYLTGLLVEEILATNDIEGVRSTRKEIEAVLNDPESNRFKRFREMTTLYERLLADPEDRPEFPRAAADVRELYDALLGDEIDPGELPDGDLFRAGIVTITDGVREIHRAPLGEESITRRLEIFLDAQHSQHHRLVNALIGHFMFEFTHPFYDGNGRVGRFLLAFRMLDILSAPTAMSLSHQFSLQQKHYYSAFQSAEDSLNHAEVTYFVDALLGMVRDAQTDLIDSLSLKERQLGTLSDFLAHSDLPKDERLIFSPLAQAHLFGPERPVALRDIEQHESRSWNTLRNAAAALEGRGLIRAVRKRPLFYALTPEGLDALGLNADPGR